MNPRRQNRPAVRRRLPVTWQDCVWFPPVLARNRFRDARTRHPVKWPLQIITDPTVCAARTVDLIKHEN